MDDRASSWLRSFARRRLTPIPDVRVLELHALEEDAIAAARIVWRRRRVNEALSVDLAVALRDVAPNDARIDAALTRLEEDEARHVLLAAEVLERLGDHAHDARAELPFLDGDHRVAFAKSVVTALCVCESVSAARFAAVREHTDLPGFAACIEAFHRDELAHAELGFVLLPLALLATDAHEAIVKELRTTFGHLDRAIGLDLERRGLPVARPQPPNNPGIVEPAIDALAFYRAIHESVIPRLEAAGLTATRAWRERFASSTGW